MSQGNGTQILAFLAVSLLVLAPWSMRAQEPVMDKPTTVGLYLQSLSMIDTSANSFTVDFYLWTVSSAAGPDPLAPFSLPQSQNRKILENWIERSEETLWSVRQVRAVMAKDWDMSNYPFDRHRVQLVIGPYSDASEVPPFVIDQKNSGFGSLAATTGWDIQDFHLSVKSVKYPTNFGDPFAHEKNNSYKWVVASFELHRQGAWIFANLMVGANIAFFAAMLACFMKTNHPPIFAGRMSLQIAALFAIIINHRQILPTGGRLTITTLPDELHLRLYLLVFASLLLTLRSRMLNEAGREEFAVRWERRGTLILLAIFLIANITLVTRAITAPPARDMSDNITIQTLEHSTP
jgi:hypothetical protein